MIEEERLLVTAALDGGGPDVFVEIRPPEALEEDVAETTFRFERLTESIQAVAERVSAAIDNAKPDKATVEFGVDVGLKEGGLTAIIAKGSVTATMKVTLEWDRAARLQQGR